MMGGANEIAYGKTRENTDQNNEQPSFFGNAIEKQMAKYIGRARLAGQRQKRDAETERNSPKQEQRVHGR